ncbi:MAG: GNAT family protein, partial [Candidatus Uhrbacteria bacterium]
DLPHFLHMINDPDVRGFLTTTQPISSEEEADWLEVLRKDLTRVIMTIFFEDSGEVVGNLGLHRISWVNRYATFGIMIGNKKRWGQGLGKQATELMLEHAFHTLGLRMIKSSVLAPNMASVALHRSVGFQEDFRRPGQYFRDGEWVDEIIWSLQQADWQASRK